MKKALPVLIAIILILIIGGGYAASVLHEKYSYSDEKKDLNEYFGLTEYDQVAVVLQDEKMDFYAKKMDGICYFDLSTVQTYFNQRFYLDEAENLLIYVEPMRVITVHIGEPGYYIDGVPTQTNYIPARFDGETLYLACDYVKQFTNFSYTYYDDPSRMQVYTQWTAHEVATVEKDTQVRYRGGVKSEILREISEGEKVQIMETFEDWVQVKTEDGYIGYLELKKLSGISTEEEIPVTDYVEPEFVSNCRDHKINMVWHNIAGTSGNDTFYSMTANMHDVNVISPTWFGLADNFGNITDFGSVDYVTAAHNMGMEVWALVSNFMTAEVDTYEILSRTSTRTFLIENLVNASLKYGVDGINVDFEDLSVACGQPFIEFIRELSVRCRQEGLVLSVDNYVPIGNTDYYNRAEQGVYADYVVIMGYDEHYKGSEEAGSVASIGYVENGIIKTVNEVPSYKVINGIPLYTRLWETTGADVDSQAVGMVMANQWVKDHGVTLTWDQETCQNYGEYTNGDSRHQVWMEDAESIKVKLNVMDANGLGGVAAWCLGFETDDIWDVLAEYVNK